MYVLCGHIYVYHRFLDPRETRIALFIVEDYAGLVLDDGIATALGVAVLILG